MISSTIHKLLYEKNVVCICLVFLVYFVFKFEYFSAATVCLKMLKAVVIGIGHF